VVTTQRRSGRTWSTTTVSLRVTKRQRFIGKLRKMAVPEARAVIVTAPGEEAQADYGSGPIVNRQAQEL
jgi:hypothetical protein